MPAGFVAGLVVALGGVVGVDLAVVNLLGGAAVDPDPDAGFVGAAGLVGAEGGGGPVVEGEQGGLLVARALPAFGFFGGTGASS